MQNPNKHTFIELFFSSKYPEKIIKQYYVNLRVEFDNILSKNSNLPSDIINKIETLFKVSEMDWSKAYEIEQYLAHICDEESLEIDLKRHLVSYRNHFSVEEYTHYENEINELLSGSKNVVEKRSILLRILNELHSFYTKRAECRDYGFITRVRTAVTFLIGFFLFLLSLVYCFYAKHMPLSSEVLIITVSSGFFGASFSMLTGLKEQIANSTMEDLKVFHRVIYVLIRPFIGVGAALIFYFFIQSELLQGDLFPMLPIREKGQLADHLIGDYPEISLMIIWSFIAGFSEKLVPRMLKKTGEKI